jgi:hypothetical protein
MSRCIPFSDLSATIVSEEPHLVSNLRSRSHALISSSRSPRHGTTAKVFVSCNPLPRIQRIQMKLRQLQSSYAYIAYAKAAANTRDAKQSTPAGTTFPDFAYRTANTMLRATAVPSASGVLSVANAAANTTPDRAPETPLIVLFVRMYALMPPAEISTP